MVRAQLTGAGSRKWPESREGLPGRSHHCCPAASGVREVTEAPPLLRAGCSSKTSPIPPWEGAPPGTKHSNTALASSSELGSKLRLKQ